VLLWTYCLVNLPTVSNSFFLNESVQCEEWTFYNFLFNHTYLNLVLLNCFWEHVYCANGVGMNLKMYDEVNVIFLCTVLGLYIIIDHNSFTPNTNIENLIFSFNQQRITLQLIIRRPFFNRCTNHNLPCFASTLCLRKRASNLC